MPSNPIASYQAALDYLYSFIDHERRPPATPQDARYNLGRTHALLAAVGQPQEQFASVVVAGTKGKGSTCALLESILHGAGQRTGMWTSPHLNSYRERIQVNRQMIDQAALIYAIQRLQPVVAAFDHATHGQPTTFELGFALALRYFAERQVQVAVIEVGMGGRYDCANTITPRVSLISSISFDHMKQLGDTLGAIASQKAGILKPGVPAVTVPQHPEAHEVLVRTAQEVGAPLWIAEEAGLRAEQPSSRLGPDDEGANLRPYPVEPRPALRGAFQRENARLALGAAMLLRAGGMALPDVALAHGLATVHWPGRLEVASQAPLIVLDGAHNEASARRLREALFAEFTFNRLLLVLGISRDKHLEAILAALVPWASALVLTRSRHPRAHADLDRVAEVARPYLRSSLAMTGDIPEALDEARRLAGPDDLICVTGSLFVVGAAREALGLATICD